MVFISYLFFYHVWLKWMGKTTYQHILEQRKKTKSKNTSNKMKAQYAPRRKRFVFFKKKSASMKIETNGFDDDSYLD
jgi:hypothetical protein